MQRLIDLIGREVELDEVSRTVYGIAREIRAPVVGAMHVCCADESERECVDSFQRRFAEPLLPDLKFGQRSPFRIANLGGRYEWGAAAIAEDHFATPETADAFKLLLVKVNAHVSVERGADGLVFGKMRRYKTESVYCGALHALLDGAHKPFIADLEEAFYSEGRDRLETLRDGAVIAPPHRALATAVTSARLQARRALVEIQDRRPKTPTDFLVVPCVTLNRRQKDHEILCGVYRADWRGEEPTIEYRGLGDDPAAYRIDVNGGRVTVLDDHVTEWREARDHRDLAFAQLADALEGGEPPDATGAAPVDEQTARELEEIRRGAEEGFSSAETAKSALRTLVRVAALLDPVSAVVVFFAEGLIEMHHLYGVQRLARNPHHVDAGRALLQQAHPDPERLSGDAVGRAVRRLLPLVGRHH